jgi:hypothetical protein
MPVSQEIMLRSVVVVCSQVADDSDLFIARNNRKSGLLKSKAHEDQHSIHLPLVQITPLREIHKLNVKL